MVKKAKNEYTLQDIFNNMLDADVDALVPVIGNGQFVAGLGWVKVPALGFPRCKYFWTGANCDYACFNTDVNAADGDTTWAIIKYVWTGANCDQSQLLIGSVTNRASLGWAF